MGSNPVNLAIRFALEVAALISVGIWGYRQGEGWVRIVLAIGIPLVLTVIWGVFAVPDDPSRSGTAPVVTPGIIRLFIELGIFALATWALQDLGNTRLSLILGIVVTVHYVISYDRILWLLSH